MLLKAILKKNILLGVLFFMLINLGHAKAYFKMTEPCLKAQALLYKLRISEANQILSEEKSKTPENQAIPWLQEYCLYIGLFISENETDYKHQQGNWKGLIKSVESQPFEDAWHRFILSDMYLHRAAMRLKMNDNFAAGSDIKVANSLLKDNEKLFPNFLPDNKNIGMVSALFSAIPKNYTWLGNLLGFEGNLEGGLNKIELYLQSDLVDKEHQWLKVESAFIYALLQHNFQKKSKAAWLTIAPYTTDFKNYILLNYMRATIAGYAGKNEEQITILSAKPSHAQAQPFYYMEYMLGLAKLRKLDAEANIHLKLFTVKFKGKNYIKSAYRYLAWAELITGNNNAATTYYSLCGKHGQTYQEEDKQALNEALDPIKWPKELLEARLLFDGHYFQQALDKLDKIQPNTLVNTKHLLEFNYRKARVQQELKAYGSALVLYDKVITLGQEQSYYYAAYSALQMANIYETLNNKSSAKLYYNKAIADFPKNKEYVNSIEQKAKSGLKRIGS